MSEGIKHSNLKTYNHLKTCISHAITGKTDWKEKEMMWGGRKILIKVTDGWDLNWRGGGEEGGGRQWEVQEI